MAKKKSSGNPTSTIILFLGDMGIVLGALFLSSLARIFLPFGHPGPNASFVLPFVLYLLVGAIWGFTFLMVFAFDPPDIDGVRSELLMITTVNVFNWMVLLATLFLGFQQISRLEMIYFLLISTILFWLRRLIWRETYGKGEIEFEVYDL